VARTTAPGSLRIVPANEASWDDIQAIFGERGDPARCQCQRYKLRFRETWASVGSEELGARLFEQTHPADPKAPATTGLVAYVGSEPAGWCAVEPRTAYGSLVRNARVPWDGRTEDRTDESVWAVTCFVVRRGFRRQGISRALTRAAVDFARDRGARAVEGYPMTLEPGQGFMPGELFVGTQSAFAAAGFRPVVQTTSRRIVMRIDFPGA
jgi:GNAT superfamily N-acetyltransferase